MANKERNVYINDELIKAKSIDISYGVDRVDIVTLEFYPESVTVKNVDKTSGQIIEIRV